MKTHFLCAIAVLCSLTHVSIVFSSTITGTVYNDLDQNGFYTPGEEHGDVSVTLFEDDGDGLFSESDLQVGDALVTGSDGVYTFPNLDPDKGYFVIQPSQTAGTPNVGGLLNPSAPVIVIDDFTSPQSVMVTPHDTAASSAVVSSSNTIGGERDLHLQFQYGVAESTLHSNPYGLNDVLEFDQSAGVSALATVTWDGIDGNATDGISMGLGGIDLTNHGINTGIELRIGIDAAGSGDTLALRIYDDSADNYSEAVTTVPITNGTATTSVIVPFSDFVGNASLTSVDAIQLELGGQQPSIDMQVDYIGVIGPLVSNMQVLSSIIPEPSTLSLMAIWAAFGIIGFRREPWFSRQR